MSNWNLADVWETIAEAIPDDPALVHDGHRVSWRSFDRRAEGVADAMQRAGVGPGAAVAQYLRNRPEYLESVFASFKLSAAPVNTNYRYVAGELKYLWDNADVAAVVFAGEFATRCEEVRPAVPHVRLWLWVDDGSGDCPSWAVPYEDAAREGRDRGGARPPRSGDDLFLLYTGGTTGAPKGVMWRQDDLGGVLNARAGRRYPEPGSLAEVREIVDGPGPVHLPACPLMHGTGIVTSLAALWQGGCVVTLPGRSLDAEQLLDTVQRERVQTMAIAGDAFARPMAAALDAQPNRWELSSLTYILSSGVMWSEDTRTRLLGHHPNLALVDMFGSSEAVGMGRAVSTRNAPAQVARFRVGDGVRVITDDGRPVAPGSGEIGRVALAGRVPIGYLKDPERSATTFPVIDGVRHSIPGDYATVTADGTLVLLGRGSAVINTAGEKVFPEEVEEAIKAHPAVIDAAVVGQPDDRFGEMVTALVELSPDHPTPTETDLIEHVKSRLAGYKAPRRIVVGAVGRTSSGKLDYPDIKGRMAAALAT
jgi:acyl-CoA synthetase (AMP-forming)/AMP-acid ligase II